MYPILAKIGVVLSVVSIITDLLPDAKPAQPTGSMTVLQYQFILNQLAMAKNDNKKGILPKVTEYGFCSKWNSKLALTLTPLVLQNMWSGRLTENDL